MVPNAYLVDKQNRKKGVVLSLRDYRALLARIEELEDSLDLDQAVRAAKAFRDCSENRSPIVIPA